MPRRIEECEGYQRLLAAVEKDERGDADSRYRKKLQWVIERAEHYAEKTGLGAADILDSWERSRRYWYMNYYQDCNQPLIRTDTVRVFETAAELLESIGKEGFRCPLCNGVSKSPYECDTGLAVDNKVCDWKVYGLFGHMGKGISVFVKSEIKADTIFMPVAWERDIESIRARRTSRNQLQFDFEDRLL